MTQARTKQTISAAALLPDCVRSCRMRVPDCDSSGRAVSSRRSYGLDTYVLT